MKLPRWLVLTLLTASLVAMLSGGAWWWATWPNRTIVEFRARINAGRFLEADAMIVRRPGATTRDVSISGRFWRRHPDEELLFVQPRSLTDCIAGRVTCKLPSSGAVIIVERSRIRAEADDGSACSLRVLTD